MGSPAHPLAFPAENCVQFTSQQEQQTSQIHPRKQDHDGCEREICRVVAIVSGHVELEKFRRDNPADRKENRAGHRLTNGRIIFGRQHIERERQNNQRERGEWHIEVSNPRLQWERELKIHFRNTGQLFTEYDRVKAKHDNDPKPKQQEK